MGNEADEENDAHLWDNLQLALQYIVSYSQELWMSWFDWICSTTAQLPKDLSTNYRIDNF
jgi:hypothetical protein